MGNEQVDDSASPPPREVIDRVVRRAREWGQHRWTFDAVIVALADERDRLLEPLANAEHELADVRDQLASSVSERDRLAAQVAELVALLRNINLRGSSIEGGEEWDERRRMLIARIGATP